MNTTGQRIKVAGSLEADRRRLVCAICPITALDHCWEKHAAVPDGTSLYPPPPPPTTLGPLVHHVMGTIWIKAVTHMSYRSKVY